MDASPYCYAYTRGLPCGTQHSQVTLVTPRGILLSGSENIVCLCSAYLPRTPPAPMRQAWDLSHGDFVA